MQEDINKFIKHTVTNLERALELDDDQLTLAVLINLESVIGTYIAELEYSLDILGQN
jgi:hypothetical protein